MKRSLSAAALLLFALAVVPACAQDGPTTFPSTIPSSPPLPKEVTKIAFGSCLREQRPAPILDKITEARPDVMIWLGDNIYGDSDDPKVIRDKYATLGSKPEFQRLKAAVPFLATWDDHDMGKNDAGADYAFIEQNKKIMLDFFGEPADSDRRKRAGVYDSATFTSQGKRVQVILLDTRSFRSPLKSETRDKKKFYLATDDPNATVLGAAQWHWLEEELKIPADVRLICSSIQVISDKHRFEKWANFPSDRDRLLKLLDATQGHVLILSGDRHHASRYQHGRLLEVTASSFNQGGTPGPDEQADFPDAQFFSGTNFGMIEFAPQTQRDDKGEAKGELFKVRVNDLQGQPQITFTSGGFEK